MKRDKSETVPIIEARAHTTRPAHGGSGGQSGGSGTKTRQRARRDAGLGFE
jgi:hypothetical protein